MAGQKIYLVLNQGCLWFFAQNGAKYLTCVITHVKLIIREYRTRDNLNGTCQECGLLLLSLSSKGYKRSLDRRTLNCEVDSKLSLVF